MQFLLDVEHTAHVTEGVRQNKLDVTKAHS